jgi:hypothetical protein
MPELLTKCLNSIKCSWEPTLTGVYIAAVNHAIAILNATAGNAREHKKEASSSGFQSQCVTAINSFLPTSEQVI